MSGQPREQVQLRRGIDGVCLLSVRSSLRLWRAFSEEYSITVAHTGYGSWSYRQRQWRTGEGWLMLMEPGEVHVTLDVRHPADFDVLLIDPVWMRQLFVELWDTEHVHFKTGEIWHPALHRALCSWIAAVHRSTPELLLASQLRGNMLSLLQLTAERGAHRERAAMHPRIARAHHLLRQVPRGEPSHSVAEIAREVGMHPDALCHGFRRQYGLSPKKFQACVRVAAGRGLLLQGPTAELPSLASVASHLGYCDQSHMAREFRALLGSAPSHLARAVGGWRD